MIDPLKRRDLDRSVLVSLERLVPADHFYRHLDATLDLSFVRDWTKDSYADQGRPGIDPVVFFKLVLIQFFEGIRSERQLIELASLNLAHRWYSGFHLDEALSDHSSLSRIRDRYELEIFRRFLDAIVEQCEQAGLVWGKELYIDATRILANASTSSMAPRLAVEAHLERLFGSESQEGEEQPAKGDDTQAAPITLPTTLSEGAYQEMAKDNEVRHDWIAEAGRQNRAVVDHDYQRNADFKASTTDPDASLMRSAGAGSRPDYQTHYVVDGGKARIIRTVLVAPSEVVENLPMQDLIWHTCFRWKVLPHHVAGDSKYGTIENIAALEDMSIRA